LFDQPLDPVAQQRFAAGQAQLAHAQPDEQPRQSGDLLEAEQLRALQKDEILAEHLPRHAVRAAHVAPVRHRDPQVAQGGLQCIGYGIHRRRASIAKKGRVPQVGRPCVLLQLTPRPR
jgi:hypothetical protein